jgi:hypothetical protein
MTLGTQTQPLGKLLDFEQFIDHQLQRTRKRIRLTDITTACLTLAGAFLATLFLEVVFDHVLEMPLVLRWIILVAGMTAAVGYSAFRIILPLVLRINSLYAAKTIEDADQSFKNSLINYLELRRDRAQLPKAVLATLESRAVNDLTHVDVEGVVNQQRMTRTFYALMGVIVVFCLYALFAPKSILDSTRRAFLADVVRPTNTQLANIKPGANKELAEKVAGEHVSFEVDVLGVRPQKVQLHYSVDGGRFFAVKEFSPGRHLYDPWQLMMTNVQQSMDYFLTGGDAKSLDYRVEVRPAPTVTSITHDLEFPAYTRVEPRTGIEGGSIEAIEGTKVTIHARTNMPARTATLDLSTDSPKVMEVAPKDPTSLIGSFIVTKSGTYKIDFRTTGNQVNPNPVNYDITALPDREPSARFLQPDQPATKAHANVKVALEMTGTDDHGVKDANLSVMRGTEKLVSRNVLEGQSPPREFRATEVLDLAQLHAKPGDMISYWLTVRDNREPVSHRVETQHQVIEVTEPASPEEKQRLDDEERKERERREAAARARPEEPPPADTPENASTPKDDQYSQVESGGPGKEGGQASERQKGSADRGTTAGDDNAGGNRGRPEDDQGEITPEKRQQLEQFLKEYDRKKSQGGRGARQDGQQPGGNNEGANRPDGQPSSSGESSPASGAKGSTANPGQSPPPSERTGPGNNPQPPQGGTNPGDPGTQVERGIRDASQPPAQDGPQRANDTKPGASPAGAPDERASQQPDGNRSESRGTNAQGGAPQAESASADQKNARARNDARSQASPNQNSPASPGAAPGEDRSGDRSSTEPGKTPTGAGQRPGGAPTAGDRQTGPEHGEPGKEGSAKPQDAKTGKGDLGRGNGTKGGRGDQAGPRDGGAEDDRGQRKADAAKGDGSKGRDAGNRPQTPEGPNAGDRANPPGTNSTDRPGESAGSERPSGSNTKPSKPSATGKQAAPDSQPARSDAKAGEPKSQPGDKQAAPDSQPARTDAKAGEPKSQPGDKQAAPDSQPARTDAKSGAPQRKPGDRANEGGNVPPSAKDAPGTATGDRGEQTPGAKRPETGAEPAAGAQRPGSKPPPADPSSRAGTPDRPQSEDAAAKTAKDPSAAQPSGQPPAASASKNDQSRTDAASKDARNTSSSPPSGKPAGDRSPSPSGAQPSASDQPAPDRPSGSRSPEDNINPKDLRRPDSERPDLPRASQPAGEERDQNPGANSSPSSAPNQKPSSPAPEPGPGGKRSSNRATQSPEGQRKDQTTADSSAPKASPKEPESTRPESSRSADQDRTRSSTPPPPSSRPPQPPNMPLDQQESQPPQSQPSEPPQSEKPPEPPTGQRSNVPHQDSPNPGKNPSQASPSAEQQQQSQSQSQPKPKSESQSQSQPKPKSQSQSQSQSKSQSQSSQSQSQSQSDGAGQSSTPGSEPGEGRSGEGKSGAQGQKGSGQKGSEQRGAGQKGDGPETGGSPSAKGSPGGDRAGSEQANAEGATSGSSPGKGSASAPGAGSSRDGQSSQPTSGSPEGGASSSASGPSGARTSGGQPNGGGGPASGSPGTDAKAKDDSQPPPPSKEPDDPSTGTVAPEGTPQSDLVLRKLTDVLKDDQATKDLVDRTGISREQWEQFTTKFRKPKAGPPAPGRDIEVKPKEREQTPAKPAADLPGIDRTRKFSAANIRERGFMPQDNVRDNVESYRAEPPAELRAKWEAFKRTMSRAGGAASRKTARPKPAGTP